MEPADDQSVLLPFDGGRSFLHKLKRAGSAKASEKGTFLCIQATTYWYHSGRQLTWKSPVDIFERRTSKTNRELPPDPPRHYSPGLVDPGIAHRQIPPASPEGQRQIYKTYVEVASCQF